MSLVSTDGLAAVEVAVDAGVELVQQVGLVRASSLGGGATADNVGVGSCGGVGAVSTVSTVCSSDTSVGAMGAVSTSSAMSAGNTSASNTSGTSSSSKRGTSTVGAMSTMSSSVGTMGVRASSVAAVKVRVDARVDLVGKVGRMGAGIGATGVVVVVTRDVTSSSGSVSVGPNRGSRASSSSTSEGHTTAVSAMSGALGTTIDGVVGGGGGGVVVGAKLLASVKVRIDTGINLVGQVGRVRASGVRGRGAAAPWVPWVPWVVEWVVP